MKFKTPCPECSGTRYHLDSCSRKPRGIGPKRRQPLVSVDLKTKAEVRQAIEEVADVLAQAPRDHSKAEIERAYSELQARGLLPMPPPPVRVMPDPMTGEEYVLFSAYHRERSAVCPSCKAEAFWQSATIISTDRAWLTIHTDDCRLVKFAPPQEAGNE